MIVEAIVIVVAVMINNYDRGVEAKPSWRVVATPIASTLIITTAVICCGSCGGGGSHWGDRSILVVLALAVAIASGRLRTFGRCRGRAVCGGCLVGRSSCTPTAALSARCSSTTTCTTAATTAGALA
jgi:hypothetical protein